MGKDNALLVVGPAWVGDMVMAQSVFITLKKQFPDFACDVVAPEWSVPLLGRMPEVRQAYKLDVGHGELGLLKRWRLAQQLKKNHYQRAVVLPRSFKAALVPFLAGIPVRTGFSTELRYGLVNDPRKLDKQLDQTVKRFVALGSSADTDPTTLTCPEPKLTIDYANVSRLMDKYSLETNNPIVGLMPGAEYGPAKQWPVDYFKALAARLVAQGYSVWIFGSGKEHEIGETIIAGQDKHAVNLCGKTSLVEAVDLIAQLKVAVSNDSGLMHIAAAVNTRLIALYGSSSPLYTPPLNSKAIIKNLSLECSPCFKRICPYGHYKCLRDISVDDVYNSVCSL